MRILRPHSLLGRVATLGWLCGGLLTGCRTGPSECGGGRVVATYSIVAADVARREIGVAVQSKFFSVGTVVPWAKADVGAVATQAFANPVYGKEGLERLGKGEPVESVLGALVEADEGAARRQVGMVDALGAVAAHTGAACLPFAGHRIGKAYVVQGNLLAGPEVLAAMAEAFEARRAKGESLAEAMVAALQAGENAGGDQRGRQAAALLVVRKDGGYEGVDDRLIDLRVEDHPEPTVELARLLGLHRAFFKKRHARE
jgi:uncharacterized Ntn-hydrolase superfamily protein